jgi:hypothetical protein
VCIYLLPPPFDGRNHLAISVLGQHIVKVFLLQQSLPVRLDACQAVLHQAVIPVSPEDEGVPNVNSCWVFNKLDGRPRGLAKILVIFHHFFKQNVQLRRIKEP